MEPSLLRVGVFEIDVAGGTLRRAGVQVKLRQQPFLVLSFLAARPGRVITREELRERVWGGDTYVDFDQGLNYCIKEIRAALGDSAETPLYVETLPRRGYRFIAPVESVADTVTREAPDPGLPQAPATSRFWRHAHLVLTLAALATVAWLATRRPPEPRDWRRATYRRGSVASARFAHGEGIVYSAAWDGEATTVYVSTGAPDARTLPYPNARVVSVSRTGELTFVETRPAAQPVLARAPLAGGPVKEILDGVLDADAGADGEKIAVAHLVAGRGTHIEYPIGHEILAANTPTGLRLSPDGSRLAFIEHPWADDDGGWVVALDTKGAVLAHSAIYPSVEGLAWSADGERVLFTASLTGLSTSLRSMDLRGRERVLVPASGRLVVHDVARDGRVLVERCLVRGEVTLTGDDGAERDLSWFDATRATALSPDGTSLLLSESGDAGWGDYAVYLRAADGRPPVRLGAGNPTALSPDGRFALAIPRRDPNRIDLLPTGSGEVRALRHPGIIQYQWAAFTPPGDRLVFVGRQAGHNMRVFVSDAKGGMPTPLTPDGLVIGRDTISPDGSSLVGPCPPLSSCIYPLDGRAPRPIPGLAGAFVVAWEPSGRALIVRPRGVTPPLRLERLDLETGRRTPWRELAPRDPVGVRLGSVVISRDGHTLVLNQSRRLSELYVTPPLD
jgi:DNA-binding winged helix-turn-helix (wHTH) protein